ncbi:hemerythrin domain-containing protein [Calidifontibacillus erzurumensis]|uniref:Hemerythrin domain-containing protein n=1 Tax=Calidifontibacillus erzurumensis TaxID=2741433 RepID=A0A8J8GI80_9BACI|nr:hemerythrin domain-containing protein [Calidifontibacillus erzurumensis]NSL52216.1 hemerythrin domain-containing protein [Calidifontibacillus erzurumensis]
MSGPSLHKLSAHRSIHNGALSEAKDLLELLEQVFLEGKLDYATLAARSLIEHWKTRTIAHADSEEDGFYQSKLDENPELEELIIMLKRDHQLFRTIVNEIEEIIDKEGVNQEVIDRFKTLQVLNQIHNKEEETRLFH